MRKINKVVIIGTVGILFLGCGETNNSSIPSSTQNENNITLNGKVIDAEIKNSIVFLDINKNGVLDNNESNTRSKADGSYSLILTQADKKEENYLNQTAPLVAYGGEDIRTGDSFEDYLMAMTQGKKIINITPMTTLISQSMEEEENNSTKNSSKISTKTNEEIASDLETKIANIKNGLAELFGINETILDKDPIALAKAGDNSLLSHSLQLHKSAKTMKKAMKGQVKTLKQSILKSYRSLAKELRKLKRSALKNKDEALLEAIDIAMNDNELFDSNLVTKVRRETRNIVKSINTFWIGQTGTLTDNALTNLIKEAENAIVVVSDTTKPIITLIGDATVTLTEGSTYTDAGATASDNKDGDITANIVVNNSVDTNSLGTYSVTYDVNDSSKNIATQIVRMVKVDAKPSTVTLDTTKPVITLVGESTITLIEGSTYTDSGATASDDKDGDITSNIIITNSVNVNSIGTYTITYDVNDSSNNVAIQIIRVVIVSAKPIVSVSDTTKPIITLIGDATVTLTKDSTYTDAGATASDNKDGDISSNIKISNPVDTSKIDTYTVTYDVNDIAGNDAHQITRTVKVEAKVVVTDTDDYPHVPKIVDDATAIRFLNKATFGATKESVDYFKAKGVAAWVDEQLALPLNNNQYLIKMIELAKQMNPHENLNTVEEYLADNEMMFNQNVASFHSGRYRMSAWFDIALTSEDQLRQKVTYALSQIIVESDFQPIFTRRADALATYYDILHRHAFGNYEDLLNEISLNSGMGVFLTFNGSKKEYQNEANVTVYPDENYAREIMQLFSIGLMKLNMDGTPILTNGNPIPTYTQEDVNELARVFTGWDLKRNARYGLLGFKRGDYTQPLEFSSSYHDSGEKSLLGGTIPSGLTGEQDIQKAIDIIMSNSSVAPYLSKNLIMRLTKSNPSSSYVQRIAGVFQNSGGDLKAVTKAIFLDEELWNDIKTKKVIKFKEPLVAYTSFLRAFNIEAFPSWYYCGYGSPSDATASNCQVVNNSFLFNDVRSFLNQGAGLAPSVFNFYDNSFVPNNTEFKTNKSVAPEIQIQSDTIFIKLSNEIRSNLLNWEKNYMLNAYKHDYKNSGDRKRYDTVEEFILDAPIRGYTPVYYVGANKMLLNVSAELNVMEMVIDGDTNGDFKNLQHYQASDYTDDEKAVDTLVEHLNQKLTGGMLTTQQTAIIADNLKDKIFNKYNKNDPNITGTDESMYNKKKQLLSGIIFPAIRAVVTSSSYMTE